MKRFLFLLIGVLIVSVILLIYSPDRMDALDQIRLGMTYSQIAELLGKDAEQFSDGDETYYQWYVDEYVYVNMYFTEAAHSTEDNNRILYRYELTHGCPYVKKGMTYRELSKYIWSYEVLDTEYYYGFFRVQYKIHDNLILLVSYDYPDGVNGDEDYYSTYPDDCIVTKYKVSSSDRAFFF